MRSTKLVVTTSSHLRNASASCDWLAGILRMPNATSVSDAAERKSEALFASHHCRKLAFGDASILRRAVSINQVDMSFPFIPSEGEFEGIGRVEERFAKRRRVGEQLRLFGGRRRIFRLHGFHGRRPDHRD